MLPLDLGAVKFIQLVSLQVLKIDWRGALGGDGG